MTVTVTACVCLKKVMKTLLAGHGSCVEYDVCNCTEGWLGISCDIPSCHDVNNCSDQGVCIARDLCECYNGYEGIACDEESLPNLATPVFLQSEYNTTIPEHTASGSIILTVQANDTDVGRNGKITYSLAFGTEFFAISGETGEITTRIEFDYESTLLPNQFDLIAIAEDDGRPMLSSTVAVSVFISDLNDNCPELYDGEAITSVDIPPDALIGTIVHQIFAEDADSGLNGDLLYSFFQVPETIVHYFEVSITGTIRTLALVPIGMYDLRVSISDQGSPSCSLLIQVNVNVMLITTAPPTTAPETTTSSGETTHAPKTVSDVLPFTSPNATGPVVETTHAQRTMSDEPQTTSPSETTDPTINTEDATIITEVITEMITGGTTETFTATEPLTKPNTPKSGPSTVTSPQVTTTTDYRSLPITTPLTDPSTTMTELPTPETTETLTTAEPLTEPSTTIVDLPTEGPSTVADITDLTKLTTTRRPTEKFTTRAPTEPLNASSGAWTFAITRVSRIRW
ncbi:uncharacterized protein [Amphiura filiformis]|uniref:uncharacterized protein n=1 Tax=Amphiura filiformis TaxID=82378 RepID=UPI003B225A2A